jgi:hypothetical protein
MACETTRLWLEETWVVTLVVNALATKPAKTMEKIDACTRSFIVRLPPGDGVSISCSRWERFRV